MKLMCLNVSIQPTTMKFIFLVFVIASIFFTINCVKRLDLRRQLIFSYVGNCPKKILPISFGNFSIDQIGKIEYVAKGEFEIKRDFPDGYKGEC